MQKILLISPWIVFLFIAGCGSPELSAVSNEIETTAKSATKSATRDALSEVGLPAGDLLTTRNACLLAGQSETLCGCLSTELGSQLDAKNIQGLMAAVKSSLGGDVSAALKSTVAIGPQTRAALAKCGTRAAISGALGQ